MEQKRGRNPFNRSCCPKPFSLAENKDAKNGQAMVEVYEAHTEKDIPYVRMCNYYNGTQAITVTGTPHQEARAIQISFVYYWWGYHVKELCQMLINFQTNQFLITLKGVEKATDQFPFEKGKHFTLELASTGIDETTIKVDGNTIKNPHGTFIDSYIMFVTVNGDFKLESLNIDPEPIRQLAEKDSRIVITAKPGAQFLSAWNGRNSLNCGFFHYLSGFGPGKRIALELALYQGSERFVIELVSLLNRVGPGFQITVPFVFLVDYPNKQLFFCSRQAAQETNESLFAPLSDRFDRVQIARPFPFLYDQRFQIEIISTSNNFIKVMVNDQELGDYEVEFFDFELINLLVVSQSYKLYSVSIEPEVDMFQLTEGIAEQPRMAVPKKQHTRLPDGSIEYEFAVVADQDKFAKSKTKKETWETILRRGKLMFHPEKLTTKVEWIEDHELFGQISFGGRGIELSELGMFNGQLLVVDDRTGLVYKIDNYKTLIPWVFLNDGNGSTTKGFKGEWMTVKGKHLYVGSHGRELTTPDGKIINNDPMYVKTVNGTGEVRHLDWVDKFKKLRSVIGIEFPGYVIHEAAQWSDVHHKWFFMPRKVSKERYSEEKDPYSTSNILLSADENFTKIESREVGPKGNGTRGFSAFHFLPETNDQIVLAVKAVEIEGKPMESYLFMFRLSDAKVILEDMKIEGDFKFEGLVVF